MDTAKLGVSCASGLLRHNESCCKTRANSKLMKALSLYSVLTTTYSHGHHSNIGRIQLSALSGLSGWSLTTIRFVSRRFTCWMMSVSTAWGGRYSYGFGISFEITR
jgi:hypothetical protein